MAVRMLNKLFYGWRLLATGWCFLSFSLGGLFLALFVFPVINIVYLFFNNPKLKYHRAQAIIHYGFRLFIWQMEFLRVLSVEMEGVEKLSGREGTLILANHPTLIDVVILIALIKYTNCVVKKTLFKDPFMGGTLKAAGYINNIETEAIVDECVTALKSGDNLIIFPEGTRTEPGKELVFQRGAAHIAARSGVDVVPVTITCNPATLSKGHKWYHIPSRPAQFLVSVGEPLDITDIVTSDEPATVTSRRLTRYLHNYFTKRLEQFGIARAGA